LLAQVNSRNTLEETHSVFLAEMKMKLGPIICTTLLCSMCPRQVYVLKWTVCPQQPRMQLLWRLRRQKWRKKLHVSTT